MLTSECLRSTSRIVAPQSVYVVHHVLWTLLAAAARDLVNEFKALCDSRIGEHNSKFSPVRDVYIPIAKIICHL